MSRHLRWLGVGTVVLALLGTMEIARLTNRQRFVTPRGRLLCDETNFNFGVISPGAAAKAAHVFILANESAHPVRITGLRSTCGCTTAHYQSTVIAAGARFPVTVEARWSGRSGMQSAQVALSTDDPQARQIVLQIGGEVLAGLAASPSIVNFGSVRLHSRSERIVDVGGPEGLARAQILRITSPDSRIKVERLTPKALDRRDVEGPVGRFSLVLDANGEPGDLLGDVIFETTAPENSKVTVSVRASLQRALEVRPSSVFWDGDATSTRPLSRHLAVSSLEVPSIDIGAVAIESESDAAAFSVLDVTSLGSGSYDLIVRFDPDSFGTPFAFATLRIRTNALGVDVPLVGVRDSSRKRRSDENSLHSIDNGGLN